MIRPNGFKRIDQIDLVAKIEELLLFVTRKGNAADGQDPDERYGLHAGGILRVEEDGQTSQFLKRSNTVNMTPKGYVVTPGTGR